MKILNKVFLALMCTLMLMPMSALPTKAEELGYGYGEGYSAWSDDPSLASQPGVKQMKMYRYSDLVSTKLCVSGDASCEVIKDVKIRYIDTPMRVMANHKWLGYDADSYGTANEVEGFLQGNKYGLRYGNEVTGNGDPTFWDGGVGAEFGVYIHPHRCYTATCTQTGQVSSNDVSWSQPSSRITDGTAIDTSIVGIYASGYSNWGYRIAISGSMSGEVIEYNNPGDGTCGISGDLKSLCKGTALYSATHEIYYGDLSAGKNGTQGVGRLSFSSRSRKDGYTTPPPAYAYAEEIWVIERTYFIDINNTGIGNEVEVASQYSTTGEYRVKKVWSSWSSWSKTPVAASDTRKVETKTYYSYPLRLNVSYDLAGGHMAGDVNGDSFVNKKDFDELDYYVSGTKPYHDIVITNANVNGSGGVDAGDIAALEARIAPYPYDTITVPTPWRDGYVFAGWTIRQSANPSVVLTGQKATSYSGLTEGGSLSFTAEWIKADTKTIFDLTGGNWSDGKAPITAMVYDQTYELSKIPERSGYLFKGWTVEGVNGEGYVSPLSNVEETNPLVVYGYRKATYEIKNVKTDGLETTHSPWFRYVYKYNYDYKETHSSADFTIANTNAKDGTVWSKDLSGWHLTRFVSDIDMARKPQWDNYYQPKVIVRDGNKTLFTGQERSSNIQKNGVWTGDILINGTLSMYAYGETGSGRNWTGSGGANFIEYYKITSKVSDWVFEESGVKDATTINSINSKGYVLPSWSESSGWRLTGPYSNDQNTMAVSANLIIHSNGGHLVSSSNAATLLCRQYERTGYTFTGFNTKADGTGTSYPSSTKIGSLPIKEGEDFHLYAQWKKNEKPNNFLFDKVENRKVNVLSGLEYMESYLYTMRNLRVDGGDVRFVAEWILREYTFKIDPNTGTINGSSAVINASPSLLYGSDRWSTIPVAVKPGYRLEGYYTSKTAGEKVYDSSGKAINGTYWKDGKYNFDGNLSVYAHWIDVEPPVITIKSYDPAIYNPDGTPNFTNQNVKVTFDVTDEGSGLSKVELVHNGVSVSSLAELDGEKLVTLIYTATTRILDSDNYYIKATDKSGNVSYRKLVIPNIDKQKPGIDESEGYLRCGMAMNGNDSVTLKVSDDYSGIREWSYKVDYRNMFGDTTEGPWINGSDSLTAEINVPESTVANVSVRAMDNAGNINVIGSCPLTFNKVYSATTTLSDYDYVFGLYDSLYGKGSAVTDAIAADFLNYLSGDNNETAKSALRYMQTLVLFGQSKTEALQNFMTTFRYDRH